MRHLALAEIDRLDQEFAVHRMQEGGAEAAVAEGPAPHVQLHHGDLAGAVIGVVARHDLGIGHQPRGDHRVDIVGHGDITAPVSIATMRCSAWADAI